jgi:hypothetical protein
MFLITKQGQCRRVREFHGARDERQNSKLAFRVTLSSALFNKLLILTLNK